MPHEASKQLLLVEDDLVFRDTLRMALERRGVWCAQAATLQEARREIERLEQLDYAAVDLKLPDGSGNELIAPILNKFPSTRVLVVTGYGSIPSAVAALRDGAHDYLSKPIDAESLIAAFEAKDAKAEPSQEEIKAPSLAEVEWEHLQRVLHEHEGNISRAARALGLHRRSLQRKLSRGKPTA